MQMDAQNVQIVTRRSKLGLPGSRTCTKCIGTPIMMHKGALREESGEQALDVPQGDENGGQHDSQTSDVASLDESEALLSRNGGD